LKKFLKKLIIYEMKNLFNLPLNKAVVLFFLFVLIFLIVLTLFL